MSVVSLHPEGLLDLDARGELTPAQRHQLEEHLAQCRTCRLERQVRSDFRLEEEPLGADLDVQRLLSQVLAPGTGVEQLRSPLPRRRTVASRLRPVLLVAAVLLVASASAAAGWKGVRAIQARAALASVVAETQPSPAPAARTARHGRRTAAVEVAAPAASAEDELAPTTPPEALLAVEAAPLPPAQAPSSPVAVTPAVTPQPATGSWPPGGAVSTNLAPPTTAAAPDPAAPAPDAASLFARANRARRAGDRERAVELYRALVERYPSSTEAHESQAMLGRVLLVDGEASAALRSFDDYLRTGGSLREDVMADRARALGRLGRSHEEAQAWSSLLRAYPGSVHAERAQSRLRELGEP
jgi:TolA-binding protein